MRFGGGLISAITRELLEEVEARGQDLETPAQSTSAYRCLGDHRAAGDDPGQAPGAGQGPAARRRPF